MILHLYKCQRCQIEEDFFSDEPVGVCCGQEMTKMLPRVRGTFKLFREYFNGESWITSKEEENVMKAKMARTHVGETAKDVKIVPVNKYDRKVEIEELRHKVINKMKARSPHIAKRVENRPMMDVDTL